MSIYGRFTRKGPSGFGYASTAEQVTDGLRLDGKTVLLTGSNSGLGYESLRVLAMRGARVIATARTLEKAHVACASVGGRTMPLACDLSDPASVRACVVSVKGTGFKLDVILCCAGIMALPTLERAHGYELQFFTNHIGHFLLVTGLLDQLSDNGRVVMVSSGSANGISRTTSLARSWRTPARTGMEGRSFRWHCSETTAAIGSEVGFDYAVLRGLERGGLRRAVSRAHGRLHHAMPT